MTIRHLEIITRFFFSLKVCIAKVGAEKSNVRAVCQQPHLFFLFLCPDAFLSSHVWRWHRHPQRVQEKSRTSSPASEPDRRSGQLLADEGDPTERHRRLSGGVRGQGWPKFKG